MRRLVVETPIRMATAARLVAVFALYVVGIAAGLLRFGLVDVPSGLAALAAGWVVAGLALLLALIAFGSIWRSGSPGGGRAFVAFALASGLLLPPAYFAARAADSPRVSDLTTDVDDPPDLLAAARERPNGANPVRYDRARAALQKGAYPMIHPLIADAPPEEVRKLVLDLVHERRWRLVADVQATLSDSEERVPVRAPVDRIEAVARTPVLGFEDDIVIRLREEDGRTRVDMRSASRWGHIDFGVNAERIASFMEDLRTRALIPTQATQ
jgi:hypothetical protein